MLRHYSFLLALRAWLGLVVAHFGYRLLHYLVSYLNSAGWLWWMHLASSSRLRLFAVLFMRVAYCAHLRFCLSDLNIRGE